MSLYLGLMSGTSMDAIDAVLVDFDQKPLAVVAANATPFEPELKQRIARAIDSAEQVALDDIGQIDVALAHAFARASNGLLRDAGVSAGAVTAIGSHGQTLRHRPDLPFPFTWQLGDPNTLAEMTGITVVADFRRRDVAAGGQGAPLLPVFHEQVFRSDDEDRAIVNVGGIANVTVLNRDATVTGFDTGPGNRLLDAWISQQRGVDYDKDGQWASSGECDATLLQLLLNEPYIALPPPEKHRARTVQHGLAAGKARPFPAQSARRSSDTVEIHRRDHRRRGTSICAGRLALRLRRRCAQCGAARRNPPARRP